MGPAAIGLHVVALLSVSGCAMSSQETGTLADPVEVLVVVDSSPSMQDELVAVGHALPLWISDLPEGTRIGLTAADVSAAGAGENGALFGDPIVLEKGGESEVELTRQLLCSGTAWDVASLPGDMEFVCEGNSLVLPAEVTYPYLDCLCGMGEWKGNNASLEQPLDATLLRVCRDLGDEASCEVASLSPADFTGEPLLLGDRPVSVLILSDEGDASEKLGLGLGDQDPSLYIGLYEQFLPDVSVHVWGPNSESCQGGASAGIERLVTAAEMTGGFYQPISAPNEDSGDCETTSAAEFLSGSLPG